MRRYQVFAAGVSVALLLGAGTPALAKSDKGKALAKGHAPKTPPGQAKAKPKPKPHAPKNKHGVSGGGVTADGAEFSVMVREDHKHGHFNYTSKDLKVRCKGLDGDDYAAVENVAAGGDPGGTVTAQCVRFGPGKTRAPIYVSATFWDRAKGADDTVTAAAAATDKKDGADISFFTDAARTAAFAPTPTTDNTDSGDLRSGGVKVR